MNLFHLLFLISVGFLVSAVYETYRLLNSRRAVTGTLAQTKPPSVIAFVVLLGMFLLFASVPGAFLEDPHWLTNKLYWVVEKVIETFIYQVAHADAG